MAKRQDYKEINLVDYLRTIKRHGGLIAGITLGVMVVAVLLRLWVVAPVGYYQSEATLLPGLVKGEPIQTLAEIKKLGESLPGVTIQERGEKIVISSSHASPEEAANLAKKALDRILERHTQMYNAKIGIIEKRMNFIKTALKENAERLTFLNRVINGLSPFSEPQVIALQAYLQNYDSALGRKYSLSKELEDFELEKTDYRQAKVLENPSVSRSFEGTVSLAVSGLLGLFLGLFLGVFGAFAKEWWEANKLLLK
ncbi:MAG: hypothetical protein HY001_00720 [Candidatus Portnoybacteria bacterium]|nr:hypothetical protein [Candidatus Portnoybacteria bacterium]